MRIRTQEKYMFKGPHNKKVVNDLEASPAHSNLNVIIPYTYIHVIRISLGPYRLKI